VEPPANFSLADRQVITPCIKPLKHYFHFASPVAFLCYLAELLHAQFMTEITIMQNTVTISVGLVDDHVLLRRGLASLLSEKGLKVTLQADNGQRLIDNWSDHASPEVMLLDVSMPVMDGFATANWLQEHHPEVKILALTVIDDDESMARMMRCGAAGYVLKDVHPQELVKAITAVHENGYYRPC
jgi:two-component system, NarL family, invasion response regulator UvrY